MPNIKGEYLRFYLDGRDDEVSVRRLRRSISIPDLVAKIQEGTPLRAAIAEVCDTAVKPLEHGGAQRSWKEEMADEIREAGGDAAAASSAFLQGVSDEAASSLEPKVLEGLEELFEDDEDDDDADDADEDDDDEK